MVPGHDTQAPNAIDMPLHSQTSMNYLKYYNLEDYLFTDVTNAFRDRGYLTPGEFFSIVIWKANRSKTSIKRKLAKRGKNLAAAVQDLTMQIHQAASDEERLRIFLSKDWAFGMAMGTKRARQKQQELFYASERAEAPGHPFYEQLNGVLDDAGFDKFCEAQCRDFYHTKLGRPSLAPGVYFRLLLIGFFEGIGSERGIGWRVADSLSLRRFLNYGLDEATPDHVTISRTRRLLDEATHQAVFTFVLIEVARRGMLKGKTIGIDATSLEANAAMRSIVRRDTGESYMEYLRRLAAEAGLDGADDDAVRRMDRKRKKKTSNDEWVNPHDPEAEVTKMKDGTTHMAYKAEQAVDLDTGVIVAITTHGGATGDSESVQETLPAAGFAVAEQIDTPT